MLATLHFVSQQPVSGSPSVVTSWVELLTIVSIITLAAGAYHKVNCHEHGCLRMSWHQDNEGHPVCKVHHPDHPATGWFRTDRGHPQHRRNAQEAPP